MHQRAGVYRIEVSQKTKLLKLAYSHLNKARPGGNKKAHAKTHRLKIKSKELAVGGGVEPPRGS
jgi:hypothetical protein